MVVIIIKSDTEERNTDRRQTIIRNGSPVKVRYVWRRRRRKRKRRRRREWVYNNAECDS